MISTSLLSIEISGGREHTNQCNSVILGNAKKEGNARGELANFQRMTDLEQAPPVELGQVGLASLLSLLPLRLLHPVDAPRSLLHPF